MSKRRRFNRSERAALFLAADGKCSLCGRALEPGWHADHMTPHVAGGPTDVINGQALCPKCNLRKGVYDMARPLLEWQKRTLTLYESAGTSGKPPARFLIAAFPGMGKTECAAAILDETDRFGVVLVAQADTLTSWRKTLHGRGVCPAARVTSDAVDRVCAACGKPVRAAVMTYDFAAANPHAIARLLAERRPATLIPDEVHHLRHQTPWSAAIIAAHPYITSTLCLSATPFRTDEEPVPFVHTEGPWTREVSLIPDHCVVNYGYGKALTLKEPLLNERPPVVPAVFERYDADVEWLEIDAEVQESKKATLSADNTPDTARKARRHVLNPQGAWLPRIIDDADETLNLLRLTDARAGGILICRDTDHAVANADMLTRRTSGAVTVYTEDYSTRNHRIGNGRRTEEGKRIGNESGDIRLDYETSDDKWIVTVRKISEGVDIPRLRVLVYATVTRTKLFFVQSLGRVIRVVYQLPENVDQTAWVYIPDDPEMRNYAEQIEDEIAEAAIANYEEDDEDQSEYTRDDEFETDRSERFVAADPEYSGALARGESHDPDLMSILRNIGEPTAESLGVLRKLQAGGYLNLQTIQIDPSARQRSFFDPVQDLERAKRDKNDAAKTWAAKRRRLGEFPSLGDAIKACHRDLGEMFGVWAESSDVTVEQVEKAKRFAQERIKDLHRG